MMLTLGYGGVKKRKVVMQEEEEEGMEKLIGHKHKTDRPKKTTTSKNTKQKFIAGTKQIEQIEQNEFFVLPLSTPDWN